MYTYQLSCFTGGEKCAHRRHTTTIGTRILNCMNVMSHEAKTWNCAISI